MLSLTDTWYWAQIGFCASLGASVFTVAVALVFRGGAQPVYPDYPEPHCSKCCPNDTDPGDYDNPHTEDLP